MSTQNRNSFESIPIQEDPLFLFLRFNSKSTSQIQEGSNLYYTSARVFTDVDSRLASKTTSQISEGINLYYTDTRFDNRLATKTTNNIQEGANNLYYTSTC